MTNSDLNTVRKIFLENIRRSDMPTREKRRWTKFARGIKGKPDNVYNYLIEQNRKMFEQKDTKGTVWEWISKNVN